MTRLPFVAALFAAAALAACGNDDEGTGGGTPVTNDEASANVTEQLFAGSATSNIPKADEGKSGGALTVLSGGDVDFLDPGRRTTRTRWGSSTHCTAGSTPTPRRT